jgi:hypothetical protein
VKRKKIEEREETWGKKAERERENQKVWEGGI